MKAVQVSLVTEGLLDEQVLRRTLERSGQPFVVNVCYGKRGRDYVWQNIRRFYRAAVHKPFIVLADLDQDECPPAIIKKWLPKKHNANLLVRIAVREIESWLLADRDNFAKFLGVPVSKLPHRPDEILDPKREVVNLARHSRVREIREDIVPAPNSTSSVGKNYVGQLTDFVLTKWDIERGCHNSPSLDRTLSALKKFTLPTSK